MASRRKRKRERRLGAAHQTDAAANWRGDRENAPPDDSGKPARGVRGAECSLWTHATSSDLLLLRRAIREDWPVPAERRGPIMDEALSALGRADTPARKTIGLARLALTATEHNLAVDREEHQAWYRRERRAGRRFTVGELLRLSADGWSEQPRSGAWRWENCGCAVGYIFIPEAPALTLAYTVRPAGGVCQESCSYRIGMVAKRTRFGGLVVRLPLCVNGVPCCRRVRDMYLPPCAKFFGCK